MWGGGGWGGWVGIELEGDGVRSPAGDGPLFFFLFFFFSAPGSCALCRHSTVSVSVSGSFFFGPARPLVLFPSLSCSSASSAEDTTRAQPRRALSLALAIVIYIAI